ncbi:MAG: amino acid ABC transporter permease [Gammaproteobacteria bacterium]|nr:amino acid ABC transporter permease [Gammaproteobacteria bacterium]
MKSSARDEAPGSRSPPGELELHVRRAWRLSQRSPVVASIQLALFAGLVVWLSVKGAQQMGYNWQWYNIPQYIWREVDGEFIWGPLMKGLWVTLEISFWCIGLALVVGLVTALLRMSRSIAGSGLATAYLEIVRNTPLLVQLYLFYFVLSPILGIDRFWTGVVCLTLHEASFVAEIIRAGINSVDRGQWEASDSIGLTRVDVYRYVVLPQAVPLMLPPLTGQIINLIKHSAIVSVIAVSDLTTEGRNLIADTFMSFEVWFTVAGIYLVITVSLSVFVSYLEHRVKVDR